MHGRSQSTTQRVGEKKKTCHWNSIDHVVSIKKNSKQIFDFIFFFSFSKSLRTWVNNKWCNFCRVHKLCGHTLFVGLTQGECHTIQSGVLKREEEAAAEQIQCIGWLKQGASWSTLDTEESSGLWRDGSSSQAKKKRFLVYFFRAYAINLAGLVSPAFKEHSGQTMRPSSLLLVSVSLRAESDGTLLAWIEKSWPRSWKRESSFDLF